MVKNCSCGPKYPNIILSIIVSTLVSSLELKKGNNLKVIITIKDWLIFEAGVDLVN